MLPIIVVPPHVADVIATCPTDGKQPIDITDVCMVLEVDIKINSGLEEEVNMFYHDTSIDMSIGHITFKTEINPKFGKTDESLAMRVASILNRLTLNVSSEATQDFSDMVKFFKDETKDFVQLNKKHQEAVYLEQSFSNVYFSGSIMCYVEENERLTIGRKLQQPKQV